MGVFVLCPKPQNKVPESRSTSQWGGFLRIDAPTKSTPHKPKEHINPPPQCGTAHTTANPSAPLLLTTFSANYVT